MHPRFYQGWFLLMMSLALSLSGSVWGQESPPESPWEQARPMARFGYGSLLSVYWSPITGQLVASSERGFQFYAEDLTLQAERPMWEQVNKGGVFSPDMRYVALLEAQGLIVRDSRTWEPVLALNSFRNPSWSPDSQRLAAWVNGRLQIWELASARHELEAAQLLSDGAAVQWSPDSQVVAVPAGNSLVMLSTKDGNVVRIHDFAQIDDIEWSRDGRWLIVAGLPDPLPLDFPPTSVVPKTLTRLDAITGERVMTYDLAIQPRLGGIFVVSPPISLSPDGRYLSARVGYYTDPKDNSRYFSHVGMGIWEVESGQALTHPHNNYPPLPVEYTSWSPDSRYFATSDGASLQIWEVAGGQKLNDLTAYINATGQTLFTQDGTGLVVANGLWDIQAQFPQYLAYGEGYQPEDLYRPAYQNTFLRPPHIPYCDVNEAWRAVQGFQSSCPDFLVPHPLVFDYAKPAYDWKVLQWDGGRNLAITYEIDIEYYGTPEYEDEIPPEERYVIWDIEQGQRLDERVNLGEQTAWVYDLEGAKNIDSESRAFNIRRNTRFVAIGDDEIMDLRTKQATPLQGINRWEWREVWFSYDGSMIYAYDTDGRFKTFDPLTGEMLYQTPRLPRHALQYSQDLELTFARDEINTQYIFETATGRMILEAYTGNTNPLLLWNDDRTLLAVGGENKGIIIFDVLNQKRLGTLRGHQNTITSMSWNPNCDYSQMQTCRYVFASSDAEGQVILWGMEQVRELAPTMPTAPAEPQFSPPVSEIDFATLSPLWTYATQTDQFGRGEAQTLRWTQGGEILINQRRYSPSFEDLGSAGNNIVWYEAVDTTEDGRWLTSQGQVYTGNGRLIATAGRGQVWGAAFTPGGETVLTAEQHGPQNTLSGWVWESSAITGQGITRWGGGNSGFNGLAYSPDQQWIATSSLPYYRSGGRLQIWYTDRFNTQYSSLIGHQQAVTAFYWDGSEALVSSSFDGTVRRWNIHTGRPLARWDHPERAAVIQMEPWGRGGDWLLSAGQSLYLLDRESLGLIREFKGLGGNIFDLSPDGQQATAIGPDSIVRVIDLASGAVLAQESRHMPSITHLQWHPGGEVLLVARQDGSLVLLDGLAGTLLQVLRPRDTGALQNVRWSPDGQMILLDLPDGRIQIIAAADGQVRQEFSQPWRRAGVWWSPDSRHIALATYPNPNEGVYDAPSWLQIYALDGRLVQTFDLNWDDYRFYWAKKPFDLSWSEDGRFIAAFYDYGLRVWDRQSGALLNDHLQSFEFEQPISLSLWEGDQLTFWRPDGTWRVDTQARTVAQISAEGLPVGSKRRADGHVLLAGQNIVHARTNYALQALNLGYQIADWHPSCWTRDCPAILALAEGSNITLFGYESGE